jgi:hypothetical protein
MLLGAGLDAGAWELELEGRCLVPSAPPSSLGASAIGHRPSASRHTLSSERESAGARAEYDLVTWT